MTTNKKKFADAWQIIDGRDAASIADRFPNGLPPQFFRVGKFSADAINVTGARRGYPGYRKGGADKVLNADVDAVMRLLENWHIPTEGETFISYQEDRPYGRISGAECLLKINAGKDLAWTVEQLQPEIDRRKELYEPREGNAPCAYCGKQNPPKNMIEGVVIYRMQKGIGRKTGMYCKDKPCATHDQMGHEG